MREGAVRESKKLTPGQILIGLFFIILAGILVGLLGGGILFSVLFTGLFTAFYVTYLLRKGHRENLEEACK